MVELGQNLAAQLTKPCVITLSGDLGTGKSVMARAIIRALGHQGAVKSPTYTLVENYTTNGWRIAHLDLYRLNDPEELHYIAFDDIVANCDLIIVEWPDRAGDLLPASTLASFLSHSCPTHIVTIRTWYFPTLHYASLAQLRKMFVTHVLFRETGGM